MSLAVTEPRIAASNSVRPTASTFGNVYRFAGRRFDYRVGLYYNRHRYYDPRSGRFIGRDPLGYHDGQNCYAYVQNKPVNFIDPWGLEFKHLGWIWSAKTKAKGRVLVYYNVVLACKCINGQVYIKAVSVDVVTRVRLSQAWKTLQKGLEAGTVKDQAGKVVPANDLSYVNKLGKTFPTPRGIYGHEMQHVQSIKEAYEAAMKVGGKLSNKIKKMEAIPQRGQCKEHIPQWRKALLDLLKEVVDQGAGHDHVDATTKPRQSTPYAPPAGKWPDPLGGREWKKHSKKLKDKGFVEYPQPEDPW